MKEGRSKCKLSMVLQNSPFIKICIGYFFAKFIYFEAAQDKRWYYIILLNIELISKYDALLKKALL